MKPKEKERKKKTLLLVGNVFLILIMIAAAWIYSGYISKSQSEIKKTDFIRTIESMKSVSKNYLNGEKGYVDDWAAYISGHDMKLEDALEFLRSVNTDKNRYIHIVDMDSYEAYSSYYPAGEEKIDTYMSFKDDETEKGIPFGKIMKSMFSGTSNQFEILGKYRLQETQSMAVAVGTRVTLQTADGDSRDYLLIRAIPIEALKKSWVFPTEYSSAEIGIITSNGDYVIQSASMRSENFIEYIRGYNFQDDYNEGDQLRKKLQKDGSGILEYRNFKGEDCIWYYSPFGENSALDILGVINKDELKSSVDSWYIVFMICGTLIVLMAIDGAYLLSLNHSLREAARLSAQASRAKTQFLSAMSHDIRTPLNAVLGMMMIAKNNPEDPEHVLKCMDKGLQSGQHLLTLINDVLDISRIESGNITLNPETVCLPEIMEELIEMQEHNLSEKQISLQSEFAELSRKYVYADKMRLNQIYVNLLTNAVKYTETGGKIFLRLYEEKIPDNTECIRVIFFIKDNGIGMTEEFQQNMYRNFSREINSQVNNIQGTGLGLSIVKQMVDVMGGTIICESTPGKGTAFKVSIDLPVIERSEEASAVTEEAHNIQNLHILVAEDNELNWEIFYELVSDRGVTCDRAENGRECVEMLKKASPGTYSAILMDVNMPVMNGYEATREIRSLERDEWNRIPIIAMTADAFAEDIQACKDSGMNGHIAKPIDTKVLFSYLEKIKTGQL